MPVQSTHNVLVHLGGGTGNGSYYALFNMMAGSIEIIDDKVYQGLSSISGSNGSSRGGFVPSSSLRSRAGGSGLGDEILGYLNSRGYLFDSLDEELEQSRMLNREMIRFHRELIDQPIAVVPSYNCDLKCPYCWQRLYHMDSPVISDERLDKMMDAMPSIADVDNPSRVSLTLFGGEPLQDVPELQRQVARILDRAREYGFKTGAISNGVGLPSAVPLIAGKCDMVQITIDGPEHIHRKRRPLPRKGDSFTPMVEGVTMALEAGIQINVRVNTDHTNLPYLPELAEFVAEKGWVDSGLITFHIAPVKNHNPRKSTDPESELMLAVLEAVDRDERMKLYDLSGFPGLKYFNGFEESGMFSLHRFFSCEAQMNFWLLDLEGDVYTCWDAAGLKHLAVGRFDPEVELWNDKLGAWRDRTSLDIESCGGCSSSAHCGGGCQFLAFEHNETFLSSNCNSVMEGYVQAIKRKSDWLVERAKAGDHAVGFITGDGVRHAVEHAFGILEDPSRVLQLNCG